MSDTKTVPAAGDMPETDRAAFEAWCAKRWGGDRGADNFLRFETDGPYADQYRKGNVEFAWCAWRAAIAAERAKSPCGHPAELMLRSAETGEPLHCELCDDKSGRRDAEQREQELQADCYRLRAELEEARAKQRMLTDHAVRVDREAFKGNVDALSKLDLDAMDVQPLMLAVQNWDISTGRARELLRCWVLGTFKPDMLPECGEELFTESEEPREAWARLRQQLEAALKSTTPEQR